jgi:CubicO group peptidase (beta-lactamase class C family)
VKQLLRRVHFFVFADRQINSLACILLPVNSTRRLSLFGVVAILIVVSACASDGDSKSGTAPATKADPTTPTTTDRPATTSTAPAESTTTSEPAPTTTELPAPEPVEYGFSAVSPIVQDFVDERGLNGAGLIIVHRDDGVIYESYWGEFSEDRISLVASSSKMITAGVLLRLHEDGLLDIDAPVAEVVDWGAGNPDITPAQLVSNSSGLVGLLQNPFYGPYICQFLAAGTLQECAASIFNTPDDVDDIIAPDTEFRYGGAQWQVAGAVAEAVSGKSWDELIDEIYVQPCDLHSLAYNNHFIQLPAEGFTYPTSFDGDPSTLIATDNPNMEGGAYVTTGDYAKLLLMHLRGGSCDGTQVLSQDALDRMHTDRIGEVYDGEAFSPGFGYGMGWVIDRESGRVVDGGAYGAVAWLDLADGFGAYLVLEADSIAGSNLAGQLYDIIDEAVARS